MEESVERNPNMKKVVLAFENTQSEQCELVKAEENAIFWRKRVNICSENNSQALRTWYTSIRFYYMHAFGLVLLLFWTSAVWLEIEID